MFRQNVGPELRGLLEQISSDLIVARTAPHVVLCALGFLLPEREAWSITPVGWYPKVLQAYIYMGLIGFGLTILLFVLYDMRRRAVDTLADKYFSTIHTHG